jgi:hypothetical protein
MRNHPFRRALLALSIIILSLPLLVLLQFSRNGSFTFSTGEMTISGRYLQDQKQSSLASDSGTEPVSENHDTAQHSERAVQDDVRILFGGIEFQITSKDGLSIVLKNKERVPVESVSLRADSEKAQVTLSDGSILIFSNEFREGAPLLRTQARLASNTLSIELPFKPLGSSRISESNGLPLITNANGENYVFFTIQPHPERRVLVLGGTSAEFSYVRKQEQPTQIVVSHILESMRTPNAWQQSLESWRQKALSGWEKAMASNPDEQIVATYISEALHKDFYRAAIATTPKTYIDGSTISWRSTVFFGHLTDGMKSLSARELEVLGHASKLANEGSPELLAEQNLVQTLYTRNNYTLLDDLVKIASNLDPAQLSPYLACGVLENWTDWETVKKGRENPFSRLISQALYVLSQGLTRTQTNLILATNPKNPDLALSLRAGRALERYGKIAGDTEQELIGRSILHSLFSTSDAAGNIAASSIPNAQGSLSAASIYSILGFGRARAIPLQNTLAPAMWAWTCSPQVSVIQNDASIEISVQFKAGDTHYMLIRGVPPFSRIQLYNIDFRTDPRFERYDSSGWAYNEDQRTLMLKMKHRENTEYIRLFFE